MKTTTTKVQVVDLMAPIVNARAGDPPLTFNVQTIVNAGLIEGATSHKVVKNDTYVRLSALPDEIRNRVVTAIQMLLSGM